MEILPKRKTGRKLTLAHKRSISRGLREHYKSKKTSNKRKSIELFKE